MKKVLKKSFEDFVKAYESLGGKVILTGNLYEDLKKYFVRIAHRNMFYELPRDYAYDISINERESLCWLEIELFKNDNSFLFSKGKFLFCGNGYIRESMISDNDIVMQKFVLPMRELIKQMQQYYIDHNLGEEK